MSISANYQTLMMQIAAEAKKAGRDPDEIKLVAVTKNHSMGEIQELYNEGCRAFGENRVQEALPKKQEGAEDIEWHFIGTLQKKKVPKVVGSFSLIHSVDTFELAEKLNQVSQDRGVITPVLLQVNVSGEESKHGFSPKMIKELFPNIKSLPALRVDGLMTMAPADATHDQRLACFLGLRDLRDKLGLKELSMGMSGDWREAIQAGATLLRVGSFLFQS